MAEGTGVRIGGVVCTIANVNQYRRLGLCVRDGALGKTAD